MPLHQFALLLTGTLLLALLGLGLSLQLGRGGPGRWVHHALFFAVCAGAGLAAALAQVAGQRGWGLLPALALLLTMPVTRPGRADHWQRALLCAGAFLAGGWLAWGGRA